MPTRAFRRGELDQAIAEDRAAAAPGGVYLEPAKVDGGRLLVLDESPVLTPETAAVARDYATKVSSPELASLAAKYVNLRDGQFADFFVGDDQKAIDFFQDVRRLAASVLSQA